MGDFRNIVEYGGEVCGSDNDTSIVHLEETTGTGLSDGKVFLVTGGAYATPVDLNTMGGLDMPPLTRGSGGSSVI